MRTAFIIRLLIFWLLTNSAGCGSYRTRESVHDTPTLDPSPHQINAIRFDPSYYYNRPERMDRMIETLLKRWHRHGVNTIFFKVYDPVHGAKYDTSHEWNLTADFGREDLLKHILGVAKNLHIEVFAWIPAFLHKSAWENFPDWRLKLVDGTDYRSRQDSYFLCAANPRVRSWWLGFLRELLAKYPQLAGIDIAEPIVSWNNSECFCAFCEDQRDRGISTATGLTETLRRSIELVHSFGKKACITTVVTACPDGRLFTPLEQKSLTGFDLDRVLDNEEKPDWINVELIWQQWAHLLQNRLLFCPEWTTRAAREVLGQINGRATAIAHVEITPFGEVHTDGKRLAETIRLAKQAGFNHIDIYDSHQMDEQDAWEKVARVLRSVPKKVIAIFHDSAAINDARQIAGLLSHFNVDVALYELATLESTQLKGLDDFDILFVACADRRTDFHGFFLQAIVDFRGTVCWLNCGIQSYLRLVGAERSGFRVIRLNGDTSFDRIAYKGYSLPRIAQHFNEIQITHPSKCLIYSTITDGSAHLPYAIRNGGFWYFADLPTTHIVEGGRHVVFCDLLHDIVAEDHADKKCALVRIEDINPLTDPVSLVAIAEYLKRENVPFSLSLVPFYINPEKNVSVKLSDRPELIKALYIAVKAGGTIILHGSSHQYRGESTTDYEFWDGESGRPLENETEKMVTQKIMQALEELRGLSLYPVAWETPHYAASQRAYAVFNRYFSTAYERRQTCDLHGSDQMLPFLIAEHSAGGKIIPENLGYIPLEKPVARHLLRAADNNRVTRDGVASFFFHPFIDISTLRDVISGLKQMGYRFTSPLYTANQVKTDEFHVITGRGTAQLEMEGEFLHEFFLTEDGKKVGERYSDFALHGSWRKAVTPPSGYIYVAEKAGSRTDRFTSVKELFLSLLSRLDSASASVDKKSSFPTASPFMAIIESEDRSRAAETPETGQSESSGDTNGHLPVDGETHFVNDRGRIHSDAEGGAAPATASHGNRLLHMASIVLSGIIVTVGTGAGLFLMGLYLKSSIERKSLMDCF